MEVFAYKGRNQRGELTSGTIEASNTEGVLQWMKTSGISPIEIRVKDTALEKQPSWLQALQGVKKLDSNDLLMFTRQMSTLMRAGVPMIQAVNGLKNSSQNPAMVKLLRSIHGALNKGSELSSALATEPTFFNTYYVNMIRVGEGAGKLDEIFDRLYEQLEFDRRMSQKIKGVLRYPAFVLLTIVIAMLIMAVYVMPVFSRFYTSMHLTLPPLTKVLMAISGFVIQYWIALAIVTAAAAVGARAYLISPKGRYAWDKFKLRIPIIGSVLTKGTTARFCRSFGTAINGGMPIVTALNLVSKAVDNTYYEDRIGQIRQAITKGDNLLTSFLAADIFSPTELQMISVGEQTGDVETMVTQLAMLYQEEVEYEASKLAESLEPILLLFMASLVAVMMLGVFLPMWDLTQMAR